MADVLPSWLEITTDDYYPRDLRRHPGNRFQIAASDKLNELLIQQRAGAFRLRIVLRESHDLKPGLGRDPLSIEDYEYGSYMALTATEVVLVTKDGRRYLARG